MKKKKLWSSVPVWLASFLFISSWVVFGVTLALKTTNVGLNGSVTFTATGVYAKITGNVTGTKKPNTLDDILINASTTESTQTWDNVAFNFIDENTSIVTTITVENLSTERSLYVAFEEDINVNNITISRTLDSTPVTSTFSTTTISPSSIKTFVITMNVDDKNSSVNGSFDFNINLSTDEVKNVTEYSTLGFTYNETNGTATVAKGETAPTGDLVIPAQVIYNNKVYDVTTIETKAFTGCDELTSVTIPSSVTSIDARPFQNCTALTSINVSSSNAVYHSEGNCLIETASKTLIQGCKTSVIPSDGSVTSVGGYSFDGHAGLTSITIPNSVTSIGRLAFNRCTNLTSIEIPNSVTSIDEAAFQYCSSLTSIDIPESVESIGGYAFNYCTTLTNISLPSSLKTIGRTTFQYCSSLTSIDIPDSVESFGDYAFACSNLTSITIPSNVTSLPKYMFSGCSNLTEVNLPANLNSIGEDAFKKCTALTSIDIPASVTSIGMSAFIDCKSLTRVSLPENITGISWLAFQGCSALTSIEIPASVTSIGMQAFFGAGLTSVTIPSNVTSIGDYAFSTSSLTTVTIESNTISSALTSATTCGRLIQYAKTIYLKSGLTAGSYITSEYVSTTTDKTGYTKYIKDIQTVTLVDHNNADDVNYGLQQMRVFGDQSYYGGIKNYYRVYTILDGDTTDAIGKNSIVKWTTSNSGATITASSSSDSSNPSYTYIDINFSGVTPATFLEIYNCTDPSSLTNGRVTISATNRNGKVLASYTFIVVDGVNVFDADGYLNGGDTLVLHTDLDYQEGKTGSTYLNGYAEVSMVYGNGYMINFGWRNANGTNEDTYKDDGYIQAWLSNIVNLEVKGANDDSTKESYNIQLFATRWIGYCKIYNMYRVAGYTNYVLDIKNSIFHSCKESGVLMSSGGVVLSSSAEEKTLNLENVIMFDVGQRAIELQYKSTVNIKGFFKVYNFQSQASIASAGISSTYTSSIMNKAEDSGLLVEYNGVKYMNLVGLSTKTSDTAINIDSSSSVSGLETISGNLIVSYKVWAFSPSADSELTCANEFNSDGSINTTYRDGLVEKIKRTSN